METCTMYWEKLNSIAKIPMKRPEDAGLDIYTIEDNVVLKPLETRMFNTGLKSAFSKEFWIEIKERGSTGSIGLSVRSGVIDSGYRGEWKIILTNLNKFPVEFSSRTSTIIYEYHKWPFNKKLKKIVYPVSKAIAQAVIIPLPQIINKPWTTMGITLSERGEGGWGSSGK